MESYQPTRGLARISGDRAAGSSWGTSVGQQLLDSGYQIGRLRKNFIFEIGMVGAEGVHRRNAPHRGVQVIEKLFADARGDFGPISPGERVLIRDFFQEVHRTGGVDYLPIKRR